MLLSEPELVGWGERIGREVETPVVLALRGPLGAGKSVLARAVARGAGVVGHLPSPTFNLLFRYRGDRAYRAYRGRRGVEVVHLDLYRIASPEEVWELGWGELGAPSEIVLIEWPERAEALLPEDRWEVFLTIPSGSPGHESLREVRLARCGAPPELPFPSATTPAGEPVPPQSPTSTPAGERASG